MIRLEPDQGISSSKNNSLYRECDAEVAVCA